MSRVVVLYATAHGSTAGIANEISRRLRSRGHRVDVRSVEDVETGWATYF